MALGGPDCLTSFSGACTPSANAFQPSSDWHRLIMPIFDLESGPSYLLLLAITSAVYLVLVFSIRLSLRLKVNGPFGKDDRACALSTLFGLTYSVVVVVQVFLGFGSVSRHLPPEEANTMAMIGWANGFAFTFAGYFSKMSACFMLARLNKDTRASGGRLRTHGSHDDVDAAGPGLDNLSMRLSTPMGHLAAQSLPRSSMLTVLDAGIWKCIDLRQWGHRFATAVSSWILESALLAGAVHLV